VKRLKLNDKFPTREIAHPASCLKGAFLLRQLSFIPSSFSQQIRERFAFFFKKKSRKVIFWVVLFTILTRIFFMLFTDWGLDFSFYLENIQRIIAGERMYVEVETTHMPLADFLYIAMYFLNPWKENIIATRCFLKFPFLLCDIGITLAVMKIVERALQKEHKAKTFLDVDVIARVQKAKLTAGFFVAFSLPLIFQTGGGRYDSLLIFCFTMVIFFLQRANWFGVAFFAALGTSAKYIGIIFLPFVVVWLKKKKDLLLFTCGLLLGFIPLYPFLFTIPREFIAAIFLRGNHIAYGLSFWHAIYILWNGFMMKHVGKIEDTYASGDEPFFIHNLYLPLFVLLYALLFSLYLSRNWQQIHNSTIEQMSLSFIINLVFLPVLIFAATFKAVNVQVLAWFVPYCALKNKKGLLMEFSSLTIIFGLGLLLFEASQSEVFYELAQAAITGSNILYTLIISPIIFLTKNLPVRFFVGIVFLTIAWFVVRVCFEMFSATQELLQKKVFPKTLRVF